MKHRNPLVVVALTIVTLGIYAIVWLVNTREELVQRNGKGSIPSVPTLFLPFIIAVVTTFAMFFVSATSTSGSPILSIFLSITSTAAIIAMIIIPFWWFYRYSKAVAAVTKGTDGTLLYILLIISCLIILPFIWMAWVQNDINKVANQTQIKDTPYPKLPDTPPLPPNHLL
jgi:hypothetical protein